MTRPKSSSDKRRVIVALSYPPYKNVNMGVCKNNYYGTFIGHSLLRIKDVVQKITQADFNIALATLNK